MRKIIQPAIITTVKAIFFLCCVLYFSPLSAKHIIGGVMYYEYLSSPNTNSNRYRITMKMYRDCLPGADKADFDGLPGTPQALFSIYNNGNLFDGSLDFGAPNIKRIDVDVTNKCLVRPPNVCVEEGVYTYILDLPISTSSYTIVYQRCCRNNTISNIVRPGDIGATFYIDLTPAAQSLKNSCPQFGNFPPIAICSNFPVVFDHKGVDKDGDSLTYEMCAPLQGGGNILTDPGSSSCFGVTPNPDCPPPYDPVVFRNPYSATNPLGGNPVVNIDHLSGMLAGTPTAIGQFVVGICMNEYRNGVLLSTVRRDFQFNLASCEKVVNALSEINGVTANNFDIKLCGDTLLNIFNKSTLEKNIQDYTWEFRHKGTIITKLTKDFSIPLELGLYTGTLFLNKGLQCSDSMNFRLNVFPDIRANFSSSYDTCYGKEINLKNLSVSDAGPIRRTSWTANGVVFSTQWDAIFNTLAPDYYRLKVEVEDENGCVDTLTKLAPFFPLPKEGIDPPDPAIGCQPYLHQFQKPKDYLTDAYDLTWDFGDGSTGKGVMPQHLYIEHGIFDVNIEVTNPFGCKVGDHFDNVITVRQSPIAGFSYLPEKPSNFNFTIQIKDESSLTDHWYYDFDGKANSTFPSPSYTFPDTGIYYITQYVTAANGCTDTLRKLVDVAPRYTVYLPNAFTPGIDGLNDSFRPAGIPYGVTNYTMYIFDRWGKNIFQTNNFNEGWPGKDKSGRNMLPGAYAVKLVFREPRGKFVQINGTAILLQ